VQSGSERLKSSLACPSLQPEPRSLTIAREPRGLAPALVLDRIAARTRATNMVGGVKRHCPGLLQILPWSRRSSASDWLLPLGLLESGPRAIALSHITSHASALDLEALPKRRMSASKRQTARRRSEWPIRAHGVDDQAAARAATTSAMAAADSRSGPGFCSAPAHVRDRGIRGESRIDPGPGPPPALSSCARTHSRASSSYDAHVRWRVLPLSGTRTLPCAAPASERRFDANVPLPAGDETCESRAWNDRGQVATDRRCHCVECTRPRSPVDIMAALVASEVVRVRASAGSGRHGIVGLLSCVQIGHCAEMAIPATYKSRRLHASAHRLASLHSKADDRVANKRYRSGA